MIPTLKTAGVGRRRIDGRFYTLHRLHRDRHERGAVVDLRRLIVLALCLLALLITWSGAPVTADQPGLAASIVRVEDGVSICYTGCAGAVVPSSDASFEQQVIELVNAERAARGLPPLKLSSALRDAARYHATDMAQDGYFEHDTYDRAGGQLKRVCDTWSRIGSYYPSPWGENIAAGYTTPASVMSGWMNSSGHRDNLLNPNHREIGVGYTRGGSWRHYWVQDFGTRSDVYPLVINREAASTDSIHVSLYIYGDWDQVRLRNDGGAWSSWRPFAHTLDWTLPARAGRHTVQAEMRAGGRTTTGSDTISLAAAPALGGLPDEMRFLYSRSDRRLLPGVALGTPRNVGNDARFTWRASVTGSHFQGERLSGQDGDSFRIVPTGLDQAPAGTYRGTATVAVEGLEGVAGSPQQIALTLQVIDRAFEVVYLPTVVKE